MPGKLEGLDFVILLAYLGGTLALGLYLGKGIHTGKDYFLAGRSLPWWVIGMSLVASDIGGTDIIGAGGAAYSYGMAVGNIEWIGCIPAMIIGAFVFIPFFWRTGVYTIPEFMERRYNVGVRSALAVCWLAFMACNLGIMLFASAKMMETLLGIEFMDEETRLVGYIILTAALVGSLHLRRRFGGGSLHRHDSMRGDDWRLSAGRHYGNQRLGWAGKSPRRGPRT